eukprot:scaffold1690_cov182-Amphora_coffeaeformis.AAC.71
MSTNQEEEKETKPTKPTIVFVYIVFVVVDVFVGRWAFVVRFPTSLFLCVLFCCGCCGLFLSLLLLHHHHHHPPTARVWGGCDGYVLLNGLQSESTGSGWSNKGRRTDAMRRVDGQTVPGNFSRDCTFALPTDFYTTTRLAERRAQQRPNDGFSTRCFVFRGEERREHAEREKIKRFMSCGGS